MFGNGFYNPYMYQPYYHTANIARNAGGLARAGGLSRAGSGLANITMGNAIGNTTGSAMASGLSGLGKGLFSKFSFSGFLNGASKTLNVVNQAIPIFYQVRPLINNAKTMFRIIGAVKDDDHQKINTVQESKSSNKTPIITSNTTAQRTAKNIVAKSDEYVTSSNSLENPIFFI